MRTCLIASLLCLFVLPLWANEESRAEGVKSSAEGVSPPVNYVMSYFLGNGESGLHLCWSEDGLNWKTLNDGKAFMTPTVGEHKLVRDPSIVQAPDGTFHAVWTISWTQPGIGYAYSKDLIHWSEQKLIPIMENEPTVRNCWAPELFYDAPNETYYIFWSSTIPDRFEGPGSEDNYNHRQYYVTTKDFVTFSSTKLYFDPGHNVIDGFLAKDGEQYLLFYKDETLHPTPKKSIHLAIGKSPVGPFEPQMEIGHTNWIEGPSAIKIGDEWHVYYDCYAANHYGAVRSKDLKTWDNITDKLSFPPGIRHGTIFRVAPEIIRKLKNFPDDYQGFYVIDTKIHDGNGVVFVPVGVNTLFMYQDPGGVKTIPGIAQSSANIVRMFWQDDKNMPLSTLEAAIDKAVENKLVVSVGLWEATGKWKNIDKCIDYWLKDDVKNLVQKYEKYFMLKIANEAGDGSVSEKDWEDKYIEAVKKLRDAGYRVPIMIDAANWGRGENYLINCGEKVVASDPMRNIILSWHPWDINQPTSRYTDAIKASLEKNLCLLVGEFSHLGAIYEGPLDWRPLVEECNKYNIGWLWWSWSMIDDKHNLVDNFDFEQKTEWGAQVLTEIDKAAVKASIFQ